MNRIAVSDGKVFFLRYIISIVCLLISVSPAYPQPRLEHAQKVTGTKNYHALLSSAQDRGEVKIIVKVNVPFKGLSAVSKTKAIEEMATISQVQGKLMRELAGQRVTRSHNYRYIPFIALTVDDAALNAVLASAEVISVEEDIPVPPALDLSVPRIGASAVRSAGYDGSGVAVAILDTGVDKNHSFLSGSVVSEACYSTTTTNVVSLCPGGVTESIAAGSAMPYGGNCPSTQCDHGTHVAGISAGRVGVSGSPGPGVAPGASVIAIQVFSRFNNDTDCGGPGKAPCVMTYFSDMLQGLERVYALKDTLNIAAVNMSIGGGRYYSNCDSSVVSMKDAIDNLRSAGIASIISSGNDGYTDSISAPACISTAISAGSTTDAETVATYSNSASFLTLLAPGSSILSSIPGGVYQSWNGTSMAAPHVTGAWALMKQARPYASVTTIRNAFTSSGLSVTDSRNGITKRRINVNEALNSLFVIAVAGAGVNGGTITSGSIINAAWNGTTLSGDNNETVNSGAGPYTLTASATTNVNVTWSGNCNSTSGNGTGIATCTINAPITAHKNVTATFSPNQYAVTATASGSGSGTVVSSVGGINYIYPANNSGTTTGINHGTLVTLTATANTGSTVSWTNCADEEGTVGGTTTEATCVFSSLTGSKNVAAAFIAIPQVLSVARAGSGNGIVSSNPAGIYCGGVCSFSFNQGTLVALTPAPDANSIFTGWSGVCAGAGICQVAMDSAKGVTAYFTSKAAITWIEVEGVQETCVKTPEALATALYEAGTDGYSNLIKVEQGNYLGLFAYRGGENYDLTLEGGYVPDCVTFSYNPELTVLDGDGDGVVLDLNTTDPGGTGNITVEGFHVKNGYNGVDDGGCVRVYTAIGKTTITDSIISTCTAVEGGGIGVHTDSGAIDLINNIVYGNTATSGGGGIRAVSTTGTITILNNTISGNTAGSTGGIQ